MFEIRFVSFTIGSNEPIFIIVAFFEGSLFFEDNFSNNSGFHFFINCSFIF